MTARRTSAAAKARFLRSGLSSVRSPAPAALIDFPYPALWGYETSGSSAWSLTSDSASSSEGTESLTMPQPAYRWATGPRSSAQRSATQNSPSSARSVHPTAPAYQPRSSPSRAGIRGSAAARGSPPTAGVGIRSPASSTAGTGSASWARIGVARGWTLWTFTSTGWSATVTQTLTGSSVRSMRRGAEGPPPRPLGARARRPPPGASPAWVVVAGGVDADLAGEHDLLELAAPDSLDGSLHGVLVVGRRGGADHLGALDGVRIEERHRGRRQGRKAAVHALQ